LRCQNAQIQHQNNNYIRQESLASPLNQAQISAKAKSTGAGGALHQHRSPPPAANGASYQVTGHWFPHRRPFVSNSRMFPRGSNGFWRVGAVALIEFSKMAAFPGRANSGDSRRLDDG